jgi:tRNA-specific 2-thiouridylase
VQALPERSGGFALSFDQPQWAVTPGQSAVLYHDEVCLGGGVIASAQVMQGPQQLFR